MEFLIDFLTLFFVVLGLATAIRYIVWKITDSSKMEYHYLVMLRDDNAEIVIRSALERNNFDIESKNRLIYALDLGVDEQTVMACKKLADTYSQIVFCKPEEFADIIKNK